AVSTPPSFDVTVIAAPDAVDARPDAADAVVYHAVRSDAPFTYVTIGPGAGYEVVYEDGTPGGTGGIVMIELFVVPAAHDDRFLTAWTEERDDLITRQGYLGTRLFRAVGDADFRFVELSRWSSPL